MKHTTRILLSTGLVLGLICAGRVALGASLQTLNDGEKVGIWTGKVNANDAAINAEVIGKLKEGGTLSGAAVKFGSC